MLSYINQRVDSHLTRHGAQLHSSIFSASAAVRIEILGVLNGMVMNMCMATTAVTSVTAREIARTTSASSLWHHAKRLPAVAPPADSEDLEVALFKGANRQAVDKLPRCANDEISIHNSRLV